MLKLIRWSLRQVMNAIDTANNLEVPEFHTELTLCIFRIYHD